MIWFEFQKVKYLYDAEEKRQFHTVQFPLNEPMKHYQNWKGHEDEENVRIAVEKYGDNKYKLIILIKKSLLNFIRSFFKTKKFYLKKFIIRKILCKKRFC